MTDIPPEPDTFPGMETLRGWMLDWLEAHYPPPFNDHRVGYEQVREEMGADVPRRFLPDFARLLDKWWKGEFQNKLPEFRKQRQTEGGDVDVLVIELELPFDDFQSIIVGDLVRAKNDVGSAYRRLLGWCEAHPEEKINPEEAFAALRAVAGL